MYTFLLSGSVPASYRTHAPCGWSCIYPLMILLVRSCRYIMHHVSPVPSPTCTQNFCLIIPADLFSPIVCTSKYVCSRVLISTVPLVPLSEYQQSMVIIRDSVQQRVVPKFVKQEVAIAVIELAIPPYHSATSTSPFAVSRRLAVVCIAPIYITTRDRSVLNMHCILLLSA